MVQLRKNDKTTTKIVENKLNPNINLIPITAPKTSVSLIMNKVKVLSGKVCNNNLQYFQVLQVCSENIGQTCQFSHKIGLLSHVLDNAKPRFHLWFWKESDSSF